MVCNFKGICMPPHDGDVFFSADLILFFRSQALKICTCLRLNSGEDSSGFPFFSQTFFVECSTLVRFGNYLQEDAEI